MKDQKSKQHQVEKIVKEYLKDSGPRHVSEIQAEILKRGIVLPLESSVLRNALYKLNTKEGIIQSIRRGVYAYKADNESMENTMDEKEYNDFLEEFEVIRPCARKYLQSVVSVMPDGTFSLNSSLLKEINNLKVGVLLKNDCSQLVLLKESDEPISIGKNGRVKNYNILEKFQSNKIKLPVYFVGYWNNSRSIWIGEIAKENPNAGRSRKKQVN